MKIAGTDKMWEQQRVSVKCMTTDNSGKKHSNR